MSNHQNIEEYSLANILYLYSILEYTENNCKSEINPYSIITANKKLSPTKYLDSYMYESLIKNHILAINPLKNLDKVQYLDNENVDYLWAEVSFLTTIHGYGYSLLETVESMKSILYEKRWSGKQLDEIPNIIKLIMAAESLSFAHYLSNRDSCFSVENIQLDLLVDIIKIIDIYTINQVNYFLFRAAKKSEYFYLNKGKDREESTNIFIKEFNYLVNDAIKNKKDIHGLKRSISVVESTISRILFKNILKIDNYSYYDALPEEII